MATRLWLVPLLAQVLLVACSNKAVDPAEATQVGEPAPQQASPEQQLIDRLGIRTTDQNSDFLIFDKEPALRKVSPHSPLGIAPAATLRARLAQQQIESLSGSGPYILRFEIIDLEPIIMPSLYMEDSAAHDGYQATVLFFMGELAKDSIPISAKEVRLYDSGEIRGSTESAEIAGVRVRLVEYDLRPIGTKQIKREDGTSYLLGAGGWAVGAASLIVETDADFLIGSIPALDPTALRVK